MPDRNDADQANGSGATPDNTAQYIGALVAELARIARRDGLDTLSFLLEMARLEADQNAKG